MLTHQDLQGVIAKLKLVDDLALKKLGLAKLAMVYDAYPLVESGRKIFCLLPKGMDLQSARKLNAVGATEKIIVLQTAGKGLAKIWPAAPASSPAAGVKEPGAAAAATQPAEAESRAVGELEFVEE